VLQSVTIIQTLARRSSLPQWRTVAQYTCQCYLIYAHKKSKPMAFLFSVFHDTHRKSATLREDFFAQIREQMSNVRRDIQLRRLYYIIRCFPQPLQAYDAIALQILHLLPDHLQFIIQKATYKSND
jgi:hypothetical protein